MGAVPRAAWLQERRKRGEHVQRPECLCGTGGKRQRRRRYPYFDKQYVDLFYNFTGFFGALLLCEPICANSLKEQGYDTKEKLIDYFYKNTTQTAKEYRDRNWSYLFEYGQALRGVEPFRDVVQAAG